MTHPVDREPRSTLTAVFSATPATDGTKFLLHLDTSDGPLNLEVPIPACRALLTGCFQSLVACAEAAQIDQSNPPGLDARCAVYIPSVEVNAIDTPGGGKKLAFRVGAADLTIWLEDKAAVQGVMKALRS